MPLTDNLISYWKMDEASGNALDAHGSNTLTDINTVGTAAGKIGTARDFELDNTESFSIADNAGLSAGDVDFTIACWVNLETLSGTPTIVAKDSASNGEYWLYYNHGSTYFRFDIYSGSGFSGPASVSASTFGTIAAGTWYHIVAWHDSVNNVIGISVNGGAANTTAASAGVFDGTGSFKIGNNSFANRMDGLIDEVGFWKRVLTSQERTDLYNGGSGLPYSSFAGGGNSPPATPTLSAGTPTSTGVTLTSSAFSDSDVGDTHAASQWQVTTTGDTTYASPVVTTGDDATNKTSYAATGLTASTGYIARVRHKDSAGNYSSWSSNASFTTASGVTPLSAGTASFVASGPAGIEVEATAPSNGTGAGPTYQWERNSGGGAYADLTGKTTLDLFDDTAVEGILYGYRCKQTRGVETVTTNAITSMLYDGGLIVGGGGLSLEELQTELNTRGLTSANMTKVATLTFSGSNVNAFVADYDVELENTTIPPTAVENATAVRTNLATELARVDVAISTRLATSGYTAPSVPPTAVAIRTEMDSNSTRLANLDAAISTRAPASTALTNATWTDAKAAFIDAAISGVSTGGVSADAIATAVRTNLATELARMDVSVSSRMATFTYTVPPTTAAIAAAVDAVVSDDIAAIIVSINTRAPASTALSTSDWSTARAVKLDNLDAAISTRSTYAGGAVTVSDKTGFKLASDGLDSISQTMTTVPSNFREKMLWVFHALWRVTRSKTTGVKIVYGSDNQPATSQATVDSDTTQSIAAGTDA